MRKKEEKSGKIININRKEIREKKKRVARIRFICFLVIIAVICFLMTPLFNISKITVIGNTKTDSSAIIKASGITYDQNIFRLNIKKSKQAVRKLPYIDDLKIIRSMPGNVEIRVTERVPVACVKYGNGYVLIDNEGRLLETIKESLGYIEVVGIDISNKKIADVLSETDKNKITAMTEVLAALDECGLTDRISVMNIKNENNVTFIVDGNKNVITGGNYRLDYKLRMLETAVANILESEAGTIDLSNEGEALFTPEE